MLLLSMRLMLFRCCLLILCVSSVTALTAQELLRIIPVKETDGSWSLWDISGNRLGEDYDSVAAVPHTNGFKVLRGQTWRLIDLDTGQPLDPAFTQMENDPGYWNNFRLTDSTGKTVVGRYSPGSSIPFRYQRITSGLHILNDYDSVARMYFHAYPDTNSASFDLYYNGARLPAMSSPYDADLGTKWEILEVDSGSEDRRFYSVLGNTDPAWEYYPPQNWKALKKRTPEGNVLLARNGDTLIPNGSWTSYYDENTFLLTYERNGLFGLLDADGSILVEPLLPQPLTEFTKGIGGKSGDTFVTADGKPFTPEGYMVELLFKTGDEARFLVRKNGRTGVLKPDGTPVIPAIYESILENPLYNEMDVVYVRKNGYLHVIDVASGAVLFREKNAEIVRPGGYNVNSRGYVVLKTREKAWILDVAGKRITGPPIRLSDAEELYNPGWTAPMVHMTGNFYQPPFFSVYHSGKGWTLIDNSGKKVMKGYFKSRFPIDALADENGRVTGFSYTVEIAEGKTRCGAVLFGGVSIPPNYMSIGYEHLGFNVLTAEEPSGLKTLFSAEGKNLGTVRDYLVNFAQMTREPSYDWCTVTDSTGRKRLYTVGMEPLSDQSYEWIIDNYADWFIAYDLKAKVIDALWPLEKRTMHYDSIVMTSHLVALRDSTKHYDLYDRFGKLLVQGAQDIRREGDPGSYLDLVVRKANGTYVIYSYGGNMLLDGLRDIDVQKSHFVLYTETEKQWASFDGIVFRREPVAKK